MLIALATFAAILAVVAVVALGILLILLPAVAIATALFFFFPSKFRRARARRSVTVIDGEFRVVDPSEKTAEEIGRDPPA